MFLKHSLINFFKKLLISFRKQNETEGQNGYGFSFLHRTFKSLQQTLLPKPTIAGFILNTTTHVCLIAFTGCHF